MVPKIRRLRGDEHGVASTVGTIMALLVFLTFLSLIVNQYVPVWMKDSEAAHMDGVLGQFGGIKSAIDFAVNQGINAQFNPQGPVFVPTTYSTAVTLGVDGVPIFSAPTMGALASLPDKGQTTVYFMYNISNVPIRVSQNSSGLIDLNVGNRYYVPQDIVYMNGAVIRAQTDGQVIRAEPTFEIKKVGTQVTLAFELVNLYGTGGLTGTSTEVVDTKVFGVNQQTYTGLLGRGLWINVTSAYGLAWYNFVNSTMASAYSVPAGVGVFQRSPGSPPTTLSFTFPSTLAPLYSVTLLYNPVTAQYNFQFFVSNNAAIQTISSFTLQQAWVNIGIGENANLGQ